MRGAAHAVNGRRFGPHVVLFGVALIVRVAWVLVVERNSFVLNDAAIYNAMGVSINEGLGFRPIQGGVSAQWPPGYGVVLAGVDVIDGRLIEVNVTCPGGMHKTDALLGTDLSGAIARRLLHTSNERVLT